MDSYVIEAIGRRIDETDRNDSTAYEFTAIRQGRSLEEAIDRLRETHVISWIMYAAQLDPARDRIRVGRYVAQARDPVLAREIRDSILTVMDSIHCTATQREPTISFADAAASAVKRISAVLDRAEDPLLTAARRVVGMLSDPTVPVSRLGWAIDTVRDLLDGIAPRAPIFDDLHAAMSMAIVRATEEPITDGPTN